MKKIMRLFLAIAMVCVMLVPVYGAQSTAYTPTDGDVIFVPGKASLTGANEAYIINSAAQTVGTKVSVQFPVETDMADGQSDQLTGRFWEMKDGVLTRINNVVYGSGMPQYGYHDGIASYNSAAGTLLLLDIANHKGSGNACGHKFAESCGVSTYQNHRGANELGPTVSVDANTKVIDLRVDVLGGITQPATTVAEVAALAVTTNGATTAPAYMVNTYAADAQATTQTDYATNAGTVDVFVLMDASADTKPAITVSAGTVLFRVGKPAWNTDTFIYVDGAYPELVGKTVTATYSGGRHEGQPNYSDQGNFWHTWNNKIVPEGCLQSDGVTANSNLTDTSHNAVAAILGTTMYTVNATGHTSATAGENSCINVCTQSTEVANADIANAAIVDLTGSGIDSIDSLKAAVAKGTVIVNFMAENDATDLVIVTGAAQDGVSYADKITYTVPVTAGTVLFRVGQPAWSSDSFVYVDGDYPELVGKTVTATYSGRWEGKPNYTGPGNFFTHYNGYIVPEGCLQSNGVDFNNSLSDTMHDVVVSIDNSNILTTQNAPGHSSAAATANDCQNGCAHSNEVKSVDITNAAIVDLSGNSINSIAALKAAAAENFVVVNYIAEENATDLVIITGVVACPHPEASYQPVDAVDATCTTPGSTAGVKCGLCQKWVTEPETVPAGHDEIPHEGKAAAPGMAGWNAYVTCSRCDYSTYTEIPALEIEDGETVNVEDFKQAGKVPVSADGFFAGWYADADHTEPFTGNSGAAHVKFVAKDVLSVKYQVTAGTNAQSTETALRLLTTVDDLNYREVGFKITFGGRYVKVSSSTVYTSIIANTAGVAVDYAPSVFHTQSSYFATFTITGVPQGEFDTEITVVPYWVTLDGTEQEGVSNTFQISDTFGN